MIAFFEQRGFTFARQGGAYRCRQHPSLAVKDDRLSWFWHSKGIGGHGALDYLVKAEHMPFRKAVEAVTGIAPITAPPRQKTEPPKTLILPEKRGLSFRLYAYLCQKRGIDSNIVNALMQEGKLYEDNAKGLLDDRNYAVMMGEYQAEQEALTGKLAEIKAQLAEKEDYAGQLEKLHEAVWDCLDIQELSPLVLNKLIDRIEIGSQEVVDGQRQQEIRIVWRFAGEIE